MGTGGRGKPALGPRSRLADVAAAAGVSLATADRAVNGRAGVRPATLERVLRAAAALEYLPAMAARPEVLARPLRIGFILPRGTSRFMDLLGATAEQGAELWPPGVRCRVEMIESFDPRVLAEHLLQQPGRADAVVCMALEHPLVRDAVDHLAEQGVPVVTLVSDLPQSRRIAYVGLDNPGAGRTAAVLLARFLGAQPAKVAIIAGSLSYRAHEEREMGFVHLLAQRFPHLHVLGLREGEDDAARNHRQVNRLLQQHPDIAGLYNIGGGAEGVAQALHDAGRAQDVVFIGHGLTADTRARLLDGTLDAVITQEPRALLRGCVRILAHYLRQRELVRDEDACRLHIVLRESLL